MNMKALILVLVSGATLLAIDNSAGDTVPAGTTIVVRTLQNISSQDRAGRTFKAKLDQNLIVNGKVALPAGTQFSGKVETSPTDPRKSRPLTVNLTAVLLGDRTTPVKTAGAFTIEQKGWTTARRGIAVSAGGFIAPAGTKLQFRLAQPLNL
jgi:hypothetical protein